MARKLITFLGRGPYRPDGSRGEYRRSRYQFQNFGANSQWTSNENKVFATAVVQWSREVLKKPFEEIVVLGTSGSAWDLLAESFSRNREDWTTGDVLAMVELVDADEVCVAALQEYSHEFPSHVHFKLIPSGASENDQAEVLRLVTESVSQGDQVWLDVTHGFRHLPMLGLASAAIAAQLMDAQIEQIVYGAGDMSRDGVVPVLSLTWMLRLMEVLSASAMLEDYQLLHPLIRCFPSGNVRNALEEAAYKIDVMRIDDAALSVRKAVALLKSDLDEMSVELKTVAGPLLQRLGKFSKQQRTVRGLTGMAKLALEQDDFLRASIFLAEAIDLAAERGIPGDEVLDRRTKTIRNWLAHAGKLGEARKDREIRSFVESRTQLSAFLRSQIDRLSEEANRERTN